MWCNGQNRRYGVDCLPLMPSCTVLDRSLRLYHIRTAASAPLPSTQPAQTESIYTYDAVRPRTQSVHSRPLPSREGLVSDEPTPNTPAPGIGVQKRPGESSRQVRSGEGFATLSASNANEQALPADQRWTGVQFAGSNWTVAGGNAGTDREGIERESNRFRGSSLEEGIVSASTGGSSSSSSVSNNSASVKHDTEILIRAIAGCDFRQQTTVSSGSLPSDPNSVQHWDTASLLCALDRLPATPEKATRRMRSAPVGMRTDALLGPGGGALVTPVSPDPVDSTISPAKPSLQHIPIPDAIRGLFSVIAPASSLLARSESSRSEGLYQSSLTASNPTRARSTHQAHSAPEAPVEGGPAATPSGILIAGPGELSPPGSPATPFTTEPGPVAGNLLEAACLSEGSLGQQQQHDVGQRTKFAGQDSAAVPLLYAAAGVALPLTEVQSQQPPAPGPTHDPAVEWALGVLSSRVTPREPRQADLRLANRIIAAHLGFLPPNFPKALTAGAAASSKEASGVTATWVNSGVHGRRVVRQATVALPWPVLLPILDVISTRLSPSSLLALLRSIAHQVGPHWRQELAPPERARLAATLRVCFRAALRNPDAVSASAAAGLMEVMSRLHVRSEPACGLLVVRILAGIMPTWTATSPRGISAQSPANGEPVPQSPGETAYKMPLANGAASADGVRACSADMSEFHGNNPSERIGARGRRVGDGRNAFSWQRWSGASSLPQSPLGEEAGSGGARAPLLLGPHLRRAQLRWACVAMSTLARLRISRFSLPQRALTKLLWAALHASAYWTPGIAAALPVWAARLDSPPPAAFLRRYSKALLGTSTSAPGRTVVSGRREPSLQRERQRRQPKQNQLGLKTVRKGVLVRRFGGDADAVSSTMSRGSRSLVDRMTAPQLVATMEALVAHYGPCTASPEAVAAAVTDAVAAGRAYKGVGHIFASCIGSNGHGRKSSSSSAKPVQRCGVNKDESLGSSSQYGNNRRLTIRYSGYRTLMHALATALFARMRQLRCQELCRLPLLMCRVGPPDEGACPGRYWQRDFVPQVRRQLPSCDVVDVMLLLRGLAALNPSEAVQAAVECADPTTESILSTVPRTYELLGSELPDEALRHYTTLLPSATLYHTAAVLESLSILWGRSVHSDCEKRWLPSGPTSSGTDRSVLKPAQAAQLQPELSVPISMAATARATVATVATVSRGAASLAPEAAGTACMEGGTRTPAAPSPGPLSTTPEAELRQRRLADLALERDFLMQQLDEHVVTCLSYSVSRRHGGSTGRRESMRNRQAEAGLRRVSVGLVVKVLAAYSQLQRPPYPRLQVGLEAALVEGADSLGTSGWQRVRAVYQQLQLQPGPELSVALLTFA